MSDERFDHIDQEIAALKARFDGVDAQFVSVDARFASVDARFASVDTRFDRVDARFDRVDARLDRVDARLDRVDARLDSLDQRLGVMHEDLIERIAGASERDAVTRQEFQTTMADMIEKFGRRLAPLEATVRGHSLDIAELKRR